MQRIDHVLEISRLTVNFLVSWQLSIFKFFIREETKFFGRPILILQSFHSSENLQLTNFPAYLKEA